LAEAPPPSEVLTQMMGGYWISQAIYVAAELGVADLLADGPRTATELAELTGGQGDALYRVLRALASIGVFTEDPMRRFGLSALGERLRTTVPGSQRGFAIMNGAELYRSWGHLLDAVRTGEEGFRSAFGVPVFQYLAERPDRAKVFDSGWAAAHGGETEPMLDAYDFSGFRSVVDIGGGNGSLLAGLLRRHPSVEGTLFDLPGVVERARASLTDPGLRNRLRFAAGDFFESVPPDADAYIMRHVIHDWQDPEAVTILRNCRDAMKAEAKLLLVEFVVPAGSGPSFGKWLDLMMLIAGGRERTEEEYAGLLTQAGLRLTRVVPTAHDIGLVEAARAA
jgi:SAM-dependent methyltransferase